MKYAQYEMPAVIAAWALSRDKHHAGAVVLHADEYSMYEDYQKADIDGRYPWSIEAFVL